MEKKDYVNKKYLCFSVYDSDITEIEKAKNECGVSMNEFIRQCVSYGFDDAYKDLKRTKKNSTLLLNKGDGK